jgi:hypothetical protein
MDTLQLLADAMLPPGDDATLTLRLRAEALCLAVAPELRQRPLYVVLTSDLPAAERSKATAGHVSRTMDLYSATLPRRAMARPGPGDGGTRLPVAGRDCGDLGRIR